MRGRVAIGDHPARRLANDASIHDHHSAVRLIPVVRGATPELEGAGNEPGRRRVLRLHQRRISLGAGGVAQARTKAEQCTDPE
jgi:hypothetical protein